MIRNKRNDNRICRDNNGSTLITVIVAIAFVTILTTIILGTTLVNVRMKGIDKRTKDDFYYAERSLNDIYTGLGQDLAKVAGDEYESAFKKVGSIEGTEDFNMAETAEKDFRKNFIKKAHDKLVALDAAALQAYVVDESKGEVDSIGSVVYQKKDGSTCTESEAYRVVLKDVQVHVEDGSGFRSTITTDIVITVPTVDFLGTNADVTDYGLIANKGLYIGGDTVINGNVYAGVHKDEIKTGVDDKFKDEEFAEDTDENSRKDIYGGVNIRDGKAEFTGNYIISKGDITLAGDDPQLKITSSESEDVNRANLWFSSLRTLSDAEITPLANPIPNPLTEPTVDINANVFALNDLTLNADNSSVIISGNYYGYNDKTLLPLGVVDKDKREDAVSSSVIINGTKSYLDMRDINNFVLMGKAYIDFTSIDETNAEATTKQVVPTAESVALKTNQQLYLVPTDFLDGANPVEGGTGDFNINIPQTDLEKWFGYQYLYHPEVQPAKIDKSYTVITSGGTVYYDYLNFYGENNEAVNKNWKPKIIRGADGKAQRDSNGRILIEKDPVYGTDIYEVSTEPLGTGGSVSSKTKFFYDIMNAKKAYDYAYDNHKDSDATGKTKEEYIEYKESKLVQPSAYRLYQRINDSMKYEHFFDLKKCVVGNMESMADAHYYAKNAVVNYEKDATGFQSNVLNNTEGMLRYAQYPEYLYNRYKWLCTRLDGNEDLLLENNPGEPPTGPGGVNEWAVDTTAPMSHFIKIANIGTVSDIAGSIDSASAAGLKPGAFGACIAKKGTLTISTSGVPGVALVSGKTFRGVAIVDGDIIVDKNINIDGLLMATGTITLRGNNEINYNKGLIQSRIEKEMNIVKNDDTAENWEAAINGKDYYVIRYLTKTDGDYMYKVEPGSKIKRDRIEADYNEFVHYENWQKGEKN